MNFCDKSSYLASVGVSEAVGPVSGEAENHPPPNNKERVLIIEDEDATAKQIIKAAMLAGFDADHVVSIADARANLQCREYHLVTLDRDLGEGRDGLSLLDWLRAWEHPVGVVVVSHLGSLKQRIEGLAVGADDYVTKPFHEDELSARLLAVARRIGLHDKLPGVRIIGDFELREASRAANWKGRPLKLSPRLFSLFWLLTGERGRPVAREEIWSQIWPELTGLPPQRSSIEAAISRLRAELLEVTGKSFVSAVRGRGYQFDV
ncbi:MAG: response regulator transcription factor [Pseudomonadota bacterium]